MSVTVNIGEFVVDMSRPFDISIPVSFDPVQLSAFSSPPARREVYKVPGFTGDVRQGGSCNCEIYHFSPHLNGTHTECVGHITTARISVHEVTAGGLLPATLVTLAPVAAATTKDRYDPLPRPDDLVLTGSMMMAALSKAQPKFLNALVVRTLPNGNDKIARDYSKTPPPYFTVDAMQVIADLGVRHLLVDMPSIDRLDDEGKLTNHHLFWDVPLGGKFVDNPSPKTVTELIYVPDTVIDGNYLLNLQIAAFNGDAAPSRPILYKVAS